MAAIMSTFPSFFNNQGEPLEDGNIYIGEENKNAKTNQVSIFWDLAQTIPAAQPLKTVSGYIVNNGTPSNVFLSGNYSIYVEDKNESFLYQEENVPEAASAAQVETNKQNIATNTANIATNTANVSTNTTAIGKNTNSRLSINIIPTSDANYTLTEAENQYGNMQLNSTVFTEPREIIMNNTERTFVFVNNELQNVTVKNLTGTGVLVEAGTAKELRNDTVNVIEFEATPDFSLLGTLDINNMIHVQDQRPSGSSGGTAVAGDNKRVLNTALRNTIAGASLNGSNEVVLPAGNYWFEAHSLAFDILRHKLRLKNETDAIDLVIGTSEYTDSADAVFTRTFVSGLFTLIGTKNVSLVHYTEGSGATSRLGLATNMGLIEVYTDIKIWKVG